MFCSHVALHANVAQCRHLPHICGTREVKLKMSLKQNFLLHLVVIVIFSLVLRLLGMMLIMIPFLLVIIALLVLVIICLAYMYWF